MQLAAIALEGLQRAQDQLDQAARRIARPAAIDPAPADFVDLSKEAVEMLLGARMFQANLKTIEVAGDVSRRVLDVLA